MMATFSALGTVWALLVLIIRSIDWSAVTAVVNGRDAAGTSLGDILEEEALDAVAQSHAGNILYDVDGQHSHADARIRRGHRRLGVQDRFHPVAQLVVRGTGEKMWESISKPHGSPWCGGRPTVWFVGHQRGDSPWCQTSAGGWVQNSDIQLDVTDQLNAKDSRYIDRHVCTTLDVDKDGFQDIICLIGADSGTGRGYNELYFTSEDGSLQKVFGHGLDKYPTMRNRRIALLKGDMGEEFVFMATKGVPRSDGNDNVHRMFKNVFQSREQIPYFQEVNGPWTKLFEANCAVTGDFGNADGRDDLVVCNQDGLPLIIKQRASDFVQIDVPNEPHMMHWRNARVADVTGDGVADLIAVQGELDKPAYLFIFQGHRGDTGFRFDKPWYQQSLPFPASDVEVLDVDGDGNKDLYVALVDERDGSYCGPGQANEKWGGGRYPPEGWLAPWDSARDLLLVGTGSSKSPFHAATMKFHSRGCGGIVRNFGNQHTLLIGKGDQSHLGQAMLLSW